MGPQGFPRYTARYQAFDSHIALAFVLYSLLCPPPFHHLHQLPQQRRRRRTVAHRRVEPQNDDGFGLRGGVYADVEHLDAAAWEGAGFGPGAAVELVFKDRLKWGDGGGGGAAEELCRRLAVVEFDGVVRRGGGFVEGEGSGGGVVVELGGEERVARLELLEDGGEGGGDVRRWFGHLEG